MAGPGGHGRMCQKERLMKKTIWMMLFIILTWGQAVFAHHLWVFEENGGLTVGRGHFPDRLDEYNPVCVSEVKGFDQGGSPVLMERKDMADRTNLFPEKSVSIVSVRCDWGDRVDTTRGKKMMNRTSARAKGFKVINAFTSTQFSKTLFAPAKANCQPLGLKFELIPLSDPMVVTTGQTIGFKLLFDGKPLPGFSVLSNREIEYTTDVNGVIQLIIENSGKQLLYAAKKVPAENNTEIDFMKFMTFLTFEVK